MGLTFVVIGFLRKTFKNPMKKAGDAILEIYWGSPANLSICYIESISYSYI